MQSKKPSAPPVANCSEGWHRSIRWPTYMQTTMYSTDLNSITVTIYTLFNGQHICEGNMQEPPIPQKKITHTRRPKLNGVCRE